MVKFVATNPKTGAKLIGIGITAANMKSLQEGKPIYFKLSEIGLDSQDEITVFFGETEEEIAKSLAEVGFDF